MGCMWQTERRAKKLRAFVSEYNDWSRGCREKKLRAQGEEMTAKMWWGEWIENLGEKLMDQKSLGEGIVGSEVYRK